MNKILKILFIIILLQSHKLLSQDISKYYGTYSGQLAMGKDIDMSSNAKYETNEITIKVEATNTIKIKYHLKISSVDEDKNTYVLEYQGENEGTIYSDLSYSATGNITVGTHQWETKQWIQKTSPSIVNGKVSDNMIAGDFKSNIDNKVRPLGLTFTSQKKKDEGKCDISISVPPEIKPGSDFYIIVEKTGCVSYYTIYYNGKDKPITNWDGKAVDVEVQVECCDHSAFMRKLKVPSYESGNKTVEVVQNIEKPGDPKPIEVAGGIAAGLILVKLLQLFTTGSGPKTIAPPPVPPQTKFPPAQKTIVKNNLGGKQDVKITEKNKVDINKNDDLKSVNDKKFRLAQMEKKMEKLRKEAKNENLSLNSFSGIFRDSAKTIPASFNEAKESVQRVYNTSHQAFDKFKEVADELAVNDKERVRFINSVSSISENLKKTCFDYYKNFEFVDDIKDLKQYLDERNKELSENFVKDPVKTVKEYVSAAVGGENYTTALETDKPLEQRLVNLGIAYYKTISTVSTGGTSSNAIKELLNKNISIKNLWNAGKAPLYHNQILLRQKLHENFPEMYEEAKFTVIKEGVRIKAKNTYYNFMDEKEKTTSAYNMNDELEIFDKWYKENFK